MVQITNFRYIKANLSVNIVELTLKIWFCFLHCQTLFKKVKLMALKFIQRGMYRGRYLVQVDIFHVMLLKADNTYGGKSMILVKDIYAEIERLKSEGFKMLGEKPVKGALGKLVCFFHPKSTNGVLIELCQKIVE